MPRFVLGASSGVMSRGTTKPFRTVLAWQIGWTVSSAVMFGIALGVHGAASAALGGAIGIAGGLVFAWLASRSRALTADGVLLAALRAEAIKMLVVFGLLALVLAAYRDAVIVALIGSFIVSILIFGFAFFVRNA